jgi:hypothetical protein
MAHLYPIQSLDTLGIERSSVNTLASLLGLDPKKLDDGITHGMLMVILVYDTLCLMDIPPEKAVFIVRTYAGRLSHLGVELLEKEGELPMVTLMIADKRYVYLPNEKEIIDLAQMVLVEGLPMPVVQTTLVLTELFVRAVRILAANPGEQPEAEAGPMTPLTAEAAKPQTPQ